MKSLWLGIYSIFSQFISEVPSSSKLSTGLTYIKIYLIYGIYIEIPWRCNSGQMAQSSFISGWTRKFLRIWNEQKQLHEENFLSLWRWFSALRSRVLQHMKLSFSFASQTKDQRYMAVWDIETFIYNRAEDSFWSLENKVQKKNSFKQIYILTHNVGRHIEWYGLHGVPCWTGKQNPHKQYNKICILYMSKTFWKTSLIFPRIHITITCFS